MPTYSCSIIFSGAKWFRVLQMMGNCMPLRISETSAFLLSSSPSFSPEAKWLHTKQKLVWCNDMLTAIHPCKTVVLILKTKYCQSGFLKCNHWSKQHWFANLVTKAFHYSSSYRAYSDMSNVRYQLLSSPHR